MRNPDPITTLDAADLLYETQADWLTLCSTGRGSPGLRAAAMALDESLNTLWQEEGRKVFFARRADRGL